VVSRDWLTMVSTLSAGSFRTGYLFEEEFLEVNFAHDDSRGARVLIQIGKA
jgi:hypothetical protein